MANEWRCSVCGTILGTFRGDGLHVTYRRVHVVVRGTLLVVCRDCGTPNQGTFHPVDPTVSGTDRRHAPEAVQAA